MKKKRGKHKEIYMENISKNILESNAKDIQNKLKKKTWKPIWEKYKNIWKTYR